VTAFEGPPLQLLADEPWQMSYGERAALEGVLTQQRPELAVEIGTAEGGSLERIAAYSRHVHSFDLVEPAAPAKRLANVTFHRGSSHELLPPFLAELEGAGKSVDFALVDGDHTSDGVRRDVEDLLRSGALGRGIVLIHDTMNETARGGLEQVPYESLEKVAYVDLDFVPGYFRSG
jgi:cephalosporin hydroxylase